MEEENGPIKESWWEEWVRQWSSQDRRLEAGTQGLLVREQVINDEAEEDGDLILRPSSREFTLDWQSSTVTRNQVPQRFLS